MAREVLKPKQGLTVCNLMGFSLDTSQSIMRELKLVSKCESLLLCSVTTQNNGFLSNFEQFYTYYNAISQGKVGLIKTSMEKYVLK